MASQNLTIGVLRVLANALKLEDCQRRGQFGALLPVEYKSNQSGHLLRSTKRSAELMVNVYADAKQNGLIPLWLALPGLKVEKL